MADLHVNIDGIASAAAVGDDLAARLAGTDATNQSGGRQSVAGVNAMDTALSSAHERQSSRASGFADSLKVSLGRYEDTDTDAGDDIAVTL